MDTCSWWPSEVCPFYQDDHNSTPSGQDVSLTGGTLTTRGNIHPSISMDWFLLNSTQLGPGPVCWCWRKVLDRCRWSTDLWPLLSCSSHSVVLEGGSSLSSYWSMLLSPHFFHGLGWAPALIDSWFQLNVVTRQTKAELQVLYLSTRWRQRTDVSLYASTTVFVNTEDKPLSP